MGGGRLLGRVNRAGGAGVGTERKDIVEDAGRLGCWPAVNRLRRSNMSNSHASELAFAI